MYTCFVEYRVALEFRGAYVEWMERIRESDNSFILYEGTDQPGLFVEVWHADSLERGKALKEERCSESSPWAGMFKYVQGGKDKIHAWVFRAC
ncbi:hypothetical protein DNH61_18420 [Paenibacillus sambharensis]|uniref:ABM domain-containing protein n=1 Tax=Paenibacillus sambharensis TaxID=1803190 RepID=A0A2W1LSF2_9BACL|nr:hypothetical protein [Paenibacillus sambharensis]PZD94377.1 hypothetical protein DNH61_18420 [Paenibacillus sambharensis]